MELEKSCWEPPYACWRQAGDRQGTGRGTKNPTAGLFPVPSTWAPAALSPLCGRRPCPLPSTPGHTLSLAEDPRIKCRPLSWLTSPPFPLHAEPPQPLKHSLHPLSPWVPCPFAPPVPDSRLRASSWLCAQPGAPCLQMFPPWDPADNLGSYLLSPGPHPLRSF